VVFDEKSARKFLTPEAAPLFAELAEGLKALDAFTEEGIEGAFNDILDRKGLKLGKLAQPVRVALTGGTVSPGIFEMIAALGRERSVKRLEGAVEFIEAAGGGGAAGGGN